MAGKLFFGVCCFMSPIMAIFLLGVHSERKKL